MYVCIYVFTYVCMYVCMCIYMYVCTYVHTYVYMYVCKFVCVYVCMCVCVCVCMYVSFKCLSFLVIHSFHLYTVPAFRSTCCSATCIDAFLDEDFLRKFKIF